MHGMKRLFCVSVTLWNDIASFRCSTCFRTVGALLFSARAKGIAVEPHSRPMFLFFYASASFISIPKKS